MINFFFFWDHKFQLYLFKILKEEKMYKYIYGNYREIKFMRNSMMF